MHNSLIKFIITLFIKQVYNISVKKKQIYNMRNIDI